MVKLIKVYSIIRMVNKWNLGGGAIREVTKIGPNIDPVADGIILPDPVLLFHQLLDQYLAQTR
jgi:hypothetical protein